MSNLNSYNRIVIKIGSAVLANPNGKVNQTVLAGISEDIAWLLKKGKDVLVVSSGAIALGRKNINLPENLSLPESQAMAAHGQIELMSAWKKHLNNYSIVVGQILLTPRDTELKISSKNAKQTIEKLLEVGCLPIINENDTTATDEIKFGDNDKLSALTAALLNVDLLIIATNTNGIYTKESIHSDTVKTIKETSDIQLLRDQIQTSVSLHGTGGMSTKIEASEIAQNAKIETWIVNGLNDNFVVNAMHNKSEFTKIKVK